MVNSKVRAVLLLAVGAVNLALEEVALVIVTVGLPAI